MMRLNSIQRMYFISNFQDRNFTEIQLFFNYNSDYFFIWRRDDVNLRSITKFEDFKKINSQWSLRSSTSLINIQLYAKYNVNVGAYRDDGTLVAWTFRWVRPTVKSSYLKKFRFFLWTFEQLCSALLCWNRLLRTFKSIIFLNLPHFSLNSSFEEGRSNKKINDFSTIFRMPDGLIGILQTDEKYQGHGYASSVVKASAKKFAQMGRDSYAAVNEGNIASRALFSKLGFVPIGDVYCIVTENAWNSVMQNGS